MFSENKGILGFFQKQEEPRELIRKWQRSLRAECRVIERQIREVEREQMKVKRSIKEAAKRQDIASCRILAKEVVASKKAVTRMYTNRAHMMSMSSALSEQLAVARVAKVLEQSTVVMKLVTELVKVPELNQQMQELAKEMMKAGLIQEMTDELLDDALDQDDLEEETEAEVDAILSELAVASVAEMPDASYVRRTEQSQAIAHDEDVAVEEPAPALNQLAS